MALELLDLTPPAGMGAAIALNGTKWGLLELDLGQPARREDLVTSMDANGGVVARQSMRDAREVTAKLQLIDATTVDEMLTSIAALESYLEMAERLAASAPLNPVTDCVRLAYTPAGASTSYSLVVLTGDITGVPKTLNGDDAGWFIKRPVVTVRFLCDPFAYGALRTYLDTTTSAEVAPSISVAGGPGDVAPWTRTAIKDVAATSRGRVVLGVRRSAMNTTATDFDGTDDRITTTYNPFTNATTRTYMGWAYRDASASTDTIFGGSVANPCVLLLQSGSQTVLFKPQNSTTTTWAAAWPGNAQWVHWALVFNESTDAVSLYINGALVSASTNAQGYNATPGNFMVGAYNTSTDPFDGKMAWVSIHTRALTAEEISAASRDLYADQLVGFGSLALLLPLDAANLGADLSGNSRTGTAAGGVTIGGYTPGPLDESTSSAVILASAMTAVAGTYSAPNLTGTLTEWAVLGTAPRQTRTGIFRVYAHRASTTATGSLRMVTAEVNGGTKRSDAVTLGGLADVYLGEVSVNAGWDMWIEGTGTTSFYGLILVPVESFVEATGAAAGKQLVGATVASDALQSTSTHIDTRVMASGGSWSTVNSASPTWPVSAANWARRSAASMGSPAFAQAGTTNHMEVQVKADVRLSTNAASALAGVYARYVDSSNFLMLGVQNTTTSAAPEMLVVAWLAGVQYLLWRSGALYGAISTSPNRLATVLQVTTDGRWYAEMRLMSTANVVYWTRTAAGGHPSLVSGGTLGNPSAAKAGLFDWSSDTPAPNRDWKGFAISSLSGVTPAPVPSGQTLRLAGPEMYTVDGSKYPYSGSSGLTFQPGVNNNLVVIGQRSANGHASTSLADTPALDIDIDGYPRYLSVPHS